MKIPLDFFQLTGNYNLVPRPSVLYVLETIQPRSVGILQVLYGQAATLLPATGGSRDNS